jgi:hypothetical protein
VTAINAPSDRVRSTGQHCFNFRIPFEPIRKKSLAHGWLGKITDAIQGLYQSLVSPRPAEHFYKKPLMSVTTSAATKRLAIRKLGAKLQPLHLMGVLNASIGEFHRAMVPGSQVKVLTLEGSASIHANFF